MLILEGVRAGEAARGADLRRARRLRDVGRRVPHHGAVGRRRRTVPRDGRGDQERGHRAVPGDYINAHGTSTPHGDTVETIAIKRAFGAHAKNLPVSSTKSMTGHLLGAAGGLEAGITVLAVYNQIVPPTINLENPDEGCDLDYVPNKKRQLSIQYALTNSFGFGGTNAALLFNKVRGMTTDNAELAEPAERGFLRVLRFQR